MLSLETLVDGRPRPVRRRAGAVAYTFAVSLITLVGFTGLVLDTGLWFNERARVQMAADAGALGGSLHIMDNQWQTQAISFVNLNSVATSEIVTVKMYAEVGSTPARVEVILERSVKTYFMAVFGLTSVTVRARAMAEGQCNDDGQGVNQTSGGFSYAVYSGNGNISTSLTGNDTEINGDFYAQGAVVFGGNNYIVNGDVHVVGELTINNNNLEITGEFQHTDTTISGNGSPLVGGSEGNDPPISSMPTMNVTQMRADAQAAGKLVTYVGGVWNPPSPPAGWDYRNGPEVQFNDAGTMFSGTYYFDNGISLKFSAHGVGGDANLVATGRIDVSGSFGVDSNLGFISLYDTPTGAVRPEAISISGSDVYVGGLYYAPYGCCDLSGSRVTIDGALICDCWDGFSGTDLVINFDPGAVEGLTFGDPCYLHAHLVQ